MLYEMLVGDPPHMASSSHGILAKVRAERPTAVSTLREGISLPVSQVVDRALAKLPVDRYPSAKAFVAALEEASRTPSTAATTGRRRASRTAFGVTAGVAIIVTATLAARRPTAPGDAEPATRFVVTPIADAAIGRAPSITPDGSALVYAGSAQSDRRLFIRRVNELAARALPGTSGALDTWISPDGTRIAFTTTDDRVKVIGWDGSRLRDVAGVFRYSNVAWLNDSVLVVDSYGQGGLAWIAAEGGALRPLTQLDTLRHDSAHGIPLALGDGTGIIFVVSRNRAGPGAQSGELSLVRHERGATHAVAYTPIGLQASEAIAYIDGWLLYVTPDGRSMMAARFDAARAVVTGVPVPVLEQDGGGLEHVMLARNGTLLYTRRVRPNNAPVLVDLHGVATPVMRGLSGAFMNPRVSPDGRRIAVQGATSQGNDAWLYDIATGTQTRLTQSGSVLGPAWSADGRQLLYVSPRDGQDAIWSSDVDGRENATRLVVAAGAFGASPARTGSVVLFQRRTLGVWSIWQAPLQVGAPPTLVVDGASDAFMPSLSPDGHWLTYASSESGRYEIYLRPFPGPGNSVRVSRDGGTEPAWSTDGRRIYFRADRRLLAATIGAGTAPTVIERRVLFADVFDGDMPMPHRNYDVLPDGKGFVMIAPVDSAAPETIVVLNWLGEMRARLAAQRPP
jgi:serine/threonine-protein kinase